MVEPDPLNPLPPAPADTSYRWARPWFFRRSAEQAHDLALKWAGRAGSMPLACHWANVLYAPPPSPELSVRAFGLSFDNPFGLAAGLDKDGVAVDLWAALGFGFVEVGTVTPGAGQPGNPSPRLARLLDRGALVNRMGFNNRGSAALAERLRRRRTRIPVGVNVGKAKVTPLERAADDYEATVRDVFAEASYIAVNVSSPNTPGLRDLQSVETLRPLLARVLEVRRELSAAHGSRPVLLKVAPDLADADIDAIADLALELGLDGVIATNTTIRAPDGVTLPFAGGVSGVPLRERADEVARRMYERLGPEVPIVGVGGMTDADDAYARIRSGARLLQFYTAFVYRGPGLVRDLTEGLLERMRRDGVESLEDVIGADVRRGS